MLQFSQLQIDIKKNINTGGFYDALGVYTESGSFRCSQTVIVFLKKSFKILTLYFTIRNIENDELCTVNF